jgi:PAS domain S-box-containing protein
MIHEKSELRFMVMTESYPSLKQILQNIEQVVWIIDVSTGQIQYVNPAFEVVWGRSRDALYTDSLTLIESVHPEDRVKVMTASLDKDRKTLNQTYRILRPDGSLRWISAHTFLMTEDTTGAVYKVCVAQDVTDQNKVDQTLRKALDRSREQAALSRRMSLARKPEVVLKTLMSASELRTAKRAFVLFFESPVHGPSHDVEVIAAWSVVPHSDNMIHTREID